jgi:hydroxymethylbilane synthase
MNTHAGFRLGTRGSALALWQANWVKREVESRNDGTSVEIIPIKTTGDRIQDVPLAQVGGKGLFTKELDEALFDGRIDFGVHSLKDVPFELPHGLNFGAFPLREEPWDAFISRGLRLLDLTPGMTIGTSSLRRSVQLRHRFPALKIVPLRGNVDTRLRKLDAGEFDGIVLAAAGLKRLGHAGRITEILPEDTMLPAVGQGALAVVCRSSDARTLECLAPLDHPATRIAVTAERGLLETLQGSCQIPIAGLGRIVANGQLHLKGLISDLDGVRMVADEITGDAGQARDLGVTLGQKLLALGADRILREIRDHGTAR